MRFIPLIPTVSRVIVRFTLQPPTICFADLEEARKNGYYPDLAEFGQPAAQSAQLRGQMGSLLHARQRARVRRLAGRGPRPPPTPAEARDPHPVEAGARARVSSLSCVRGCEK